LTLALPAASHGELVVSEYTAQTPSAAVRVLEISDFSETPHDIRVIAGPPLAGLHIEMYDVSTGFLNLPPGCNTGGAVSPGLPPRDRVYCPRADYDAVRILSGGGDDQVKINSSYPVTTFSRLRSSDPGAFITADLGSGNDEFISTPLAPHEPGGLGGSDLVLGGPGNDTMTTGSGADLLDGGPGRDLHYAGGDRDLIRGGPGKDYLGGGPQGPDLMLGGSGRDRCDGSRHDRARGCEQGHLGRPPKLK
jgi:hypothetical protein